MAPEMTVAERDALVMAPVGTPGLDALGLTDSAFADLEHLGPGAREQAVALWSRWHMLQAAQNVEDLAANIGAMGAGDRRELLDMLARALTGGTDGG